MRIILSFILFVMLYPLYGTEVAVCTYFPPIGDQFDDWRKVYVATDLRHDTNLEAAYRLMVKGAGLLENEKHKQLYLSTLNDLSNKRKLTAANIMRLGLFLTFLKQPPIEFASNPVEGDFDTKYLHTNDQWKDFDNYKEYGEKFIGQFRESPKLFRPVIIFNANGVLPRDFIMDATFHDAGLFSIQVVPDHIDGYPHAGLVNTLYHFYAHDVLHNMAIASSLLKIKEWIKKQLTPSYKDQLHEITNRVLDLFYDLLKDSYITTQKDVMASCAWAAIIHESLVDGNALLQALQSLSKGKGKSVHSITDASVEALVKAIKDNAMLAIMNDYTKNGLGSKKTDVLQHNLLCQIQDLTKYNISSLNLTYAGDQLICNFKATRNTEASKNTKASRNTKASKNTEEDNVSVSLRQESTGSNVYQGEGYIFGKEFSFKLYNTYGFIVGPYLDLMKEADSTDFPGLPVYGYIEYLSKIKRLVEPFNLDSEIFDKFKIELKRIFGPNTTDKKKCTARGIKRKADSNYSAAKRAKHSNSQEMVETQMAVAASAEKEPASEEAAMEAAGGVAAMEVAAMEAAGGVAAMEVAAMEAARAEAARAEAARAEAARAEAARAEAERAEAARAEAARAEAARAEAERAEAERAEAERAEAERAEAERAKAARAKAARAKAARAKAARADAVRGKQEPVNLLKSGRNILSIKPNQTAQMETLTATAELIENINRFCDKSELIKRCSDHVGEPRYGVDGFDVRIQCYKGKKCGCDPIEHYVGYHVWIKYANLLLLEARRGIEDGESEKVKSDHKNRYVEIVLIMLGYNRSGFLTLKAYHTILDIFNTNKTFFIACEEDACNKKTFPFPSEDDLNNMLQNCNQRLLPLCLRERYDLWGPKVSRATLP